MWLSTLSKLQGTFCISWTARPSYTANKQSTIAFLVFWIVSSAILFWISILHFLIHLFIISQYCGCQEMYGWQDFCDTSQVSQYMYSHHSTELSIFQSSFQSKTHYSIHHKHIVYLLLQYILLITLYMMWWYGTTYCGSATSISFRNPSPSTTLSYWP